MGGMLLFGCKHSHSHATEQEDQHEHGSGCDQDHDHDHSEHGHDHDIDETTEVPGAIHFSNYQASKVDFAIEKPVVQSFGQVIKTVAKVQSSQDEEMLIPAQMSGIVRFNGNNLTEGKKVSAGQTLCSVAGSGLADNNIAVRFTEAQNNYRKAEADYTRAQALAKDTLISGKEWIQIKNEYETAKAVFDNLSRNMNEKGQRITSPKNGFLKQIFVTNNQYVEAGQPLFSVSNSQSLLLVADVQPKDASLLPFIKTATIGSLSMPNRYTLEELNGKVLSFAHAINSDNYSLPVTFQIDNKAGFLPGSLVEIYIRTQSHQSVMTVPNSALTEDQGAFFVFVQLAPELYEKREVAVGMTDGILTEIRSGITAEESIVTKGALSVKLSQASGMLDPHAGHAH